MKKIILILGVLAAWTLLPSGIAHAQLAAPNSTGVSMGHVHLIVQDLDAWLQANPYKPSVPNPAGGGTFDHRWDQSTYSNFRDRIRSLDAQAGLVVAEAGDQALPSVGSVIGHIGFHVPDTNAAMARWKAAGLKTEAGQNPGQGFVWTPDNLTRVEILEDKTQTAPIAFHHVHLYIADPSGTAIKEMQSWYAKMFGAIPGKRGPYEADDVPGVNISFAKSDTPTVGSKGRMVDHIGFEIKGLENFVKTAEANGVKFDRPFTNMPDYGITLAFMTDPWGTYIELNEGLDKK